MTVSTALAVALGGAVGAPARYVIDLWVQQRHLGRMPWGTLVVNVLGTFVLGLVLGVAPHLGHTWTAVLGTGLCGALTTYSTFSLDAVRLVEQGRLRLGAAYVALSLLLGVAAALAGGNLAMFAV